MEFWEGGVRKYEVGEGAPKEAGLGSSEMLLSDRVDSKGVSVKRKKEMQSLACKEAVENDAGSFEELYRRYLARFELRYIKPDEVIKPHKNITMGVHNHLPPMMYWKNLVRTLLVADEVRHRLQAPLTEITSAYRSPAYNRACYGARNSFHTRNYALDLVYGCSVLEVRKVVKELQKEGFFRGGVGCYSSFTHIDTRGYNVQWNG